MAEERSRAEQIQVILITSFVLLILGFNNVIAFFDGLERTKGFEFMADLPRDWFNLVILVVLVFALFENKMIAKRIAGWVE